MRSVCIAFANGCPRSRMETAKLFPYFEQNGWQINEHIEEADLVLVATCGVSECSEQKSLSLLSVADKKRKTDSKLIIIGCLAGIKEQQLNEQFHATIIPPVKINDIDLAINAKIKLKEVKEPNHIGSTFLKAQRCFGLLARFHAEFRPSWEFFYRIASVVMPSKSRQLIQEPYQHDVFGIRAAKGCNQECSYCAIRFAEGPLVSKPLEKVIVEFEDGLRQGFKIFTLVAGDLGGYGQDIGTNIVELLTAILEHKADFKLHLKDFSPRWLVRYAPQLTTLFSQNTNRIGNIMLPIQSGSETILNAMKRGYSAAEARAALCGLRDTCDGILISTHVIIGFPGETDQDVQDTLDLLNAVRFDRIDIYKYSDRPQTEASAMPNKISEKLQRKRVRRLRSEFSGIAEIAC
jgi:tRNA A37 methylthiotransferase MiaB